MELSAGTTKPLLGSRLDLWCWESSSGTRGIRPGLPDVTGTPGSCFAPSLLPPGAAAGGHTNTQGHLQQLCTSAQGS